MKALIIFIIIGALTSCNVDASVSTTVGDTTYTTNNDGSLTTCTTVGNSTYCTDY